MITPIMERLVAMFTGCERKSVRNYSGEEMRTPIERYGRMNILEWKRCFLKWCRMPEGLPDRLLLALGWIGWNITNASLYTDKGYTDEEVIERARNMAGGR